MKTERFELLRAVGWALAVAVLLWLLWWTK